jgi:hypothetical protein
MVPLGTQRTNIVDPAKNPSNTAPSTQTPGAVGPPEKTPEEAAAEAADTAEAGEA